MIFAPINVTVPADGQPAEPVTIPADTHVGDYAIQARGNVDIKISNVVGMTTYWTVKAGRVDSLVDVLGPGAHAFYVVSAGAADVLEMLPIRRWNQRSQR